MAGALALLTLLAVDTSTASALPSRPSAVEARRRPVRPGDRPPKPRRPRPVPPPAAMPAPVATPEPAPPPPEPARTLGELGESCRAALDCRPELRCREMTCVAALEAPEPEPRTRLRLLLELGAGMGFRALEQRSVLVDGPYARREALVATGSALAGLELGLGQDQLLLGLAGGVAWPAGVTEADRDPSVQVDLRAGWALWRRDAHGFYLEPRLELLIGGVPAGLGLGGALAARLRIEWFDIGLRFGGYAGGQGLRKVGDASGTDERLSGASATLLLGISPPIAAW